MAVTTSWAPIHKVVLGCIAFIVFWMLAMFPAVPFLPIGRTAGSLLGAALMVVFQVVSPKEAYASVDLPILGLLFGTMVVSVYLERADLFHYLGLGLSWKSQGGKDLLVRVCVLSAICSAFFTNDTTCVILTSFLLQLCKDKNLPPQPFLIALATSANIGSAATPIGSPQNLVIAVTSGISFGKFLLGIIPAVIAGMIVNILGLLFLYWGRLSSKQDLEAPLENALSDEAPLEAERAAGSRTPNTPHCLETPEGVSSIPPPPHANPPITVTEGEEGNSKLLPRRSWRDQSASPEDITKTFQNYDLSDVGRPGFSGVETSPIRMIRSIPTPAPGFEIRHAPMEMTELMRLESSNAFHRQHPRSPSHDHQSFASPGPSGSFSANISIHPSPTHEEGCIALENPVEADSKRRKIFKICVYTVTLGMLGALLGGLDLSWSAITAGVVLMILDFGDAGPSLNQVSYSLLVFFSGMFISVEGFNKTGAPGVLWKAVEPYSRINETRGTFIPSLVVILLSNVASNVPTVLLLGTRVAQSAATIPGVSVTRAWLILAWVSTVAGNLTLVGSAANLIVSEQARRAQLLNYNLSFWNHLRFGIPSTLIIVAAGLFVIRG